MSRTLRTNYRRGAGGPWLALLVACATLGAGQVAVAGTLVNINTRVGNVERTVQIDLFDDVTPLTVANFLNYVTNGRYENTIVHRYSKFGNGEKFVLQTGGFNTSEFTAVPLPNTPTHIPVFSSPLNEFRISNTIKTVAMAKVGGNPNSATSEWFINLNNNGTSNSGGSPMLDSQNGGFTVFGWVVGDSMKLVDELAALTPSAVNFPGYAALPVAERPYQDVPKSAQGDFINIESVTIERTHPSFQNPVERTDVNNSNSTTPADVGIVINAVNAQLAKGVAGPLKDLILPRENYRYFDVNGSNTVTPADVGIVINRVLAMINGIDSISSLAAEEDELDQPLIEPFVDAFAAKLVAVPEPSSLVLAAGGLLFAAAALARRRGWRRSAN